MAPRTEPEPVAHPGAREAWFRRLPPERQAELTAPLRRDAERTEGLFRDERRRLAIAAGEMAALYLVVDLLCPGTGWGTALGALVTGAGVGALLQAGGVARLLSGTLGLLAFFVLQLATRGGLSAAHLFWFFPVGCLAALPAIRRENGD